MNLKEVKKQFEVESYKKAFLDLKYMLKFISKDSTDEDDWYALYGDLDEESFKIIAALLNMYCFNSIDLKILDLDKLMHISKMIEQINRL